MRSSYWSCSDFANWIRGTIQPKAETSEGWRNWREMAQSKHPIRYWIAEEGLDHLQTFIMWPLDRLYDVKYWINNRYVSKTHALTSNLEKGKWHEYETRLLHSMFDELLNFVETELAWWHIACDSEAAKKYNAPWYASGWFRWRTWRCPEAGLDHLRWAADLNDAEWKREGDTSEPKLTLQATNSREILALYKWWKEERPVRPDPYEASGWSAYCDARTGKGFTFLEDLVLEDKSKADERESRRIMTKLNKMEADYEKEDEKMMIRLVKVRRALWT